VLQQRLAGIAAEQLLLWPSPDGEGLLRPAGASKNLDAHWPCFLIWEAYLLEGIERAAGNQTVEQAGAQLQQASDCITLALALPRERAQRSCLRGAGAHLRSAGTKLAAAGAHLRLSGLQEAGAALVEVGQEADAVARSPQQQPLAAQLAGLADRARLLIAQARQQMQAAAGGPAAPQQQQPAGQAPAPAAPLQQQPAGQQVPGPAAPLQQQPAGQVGEKTQTRAGRPFGWPLGGPPCHLPPSRALGRRPIALLQLQLRPTVTLARAALLPAGRPHGRGRRRCAGDLAPAGVRGLAGHSLARAQAAVPARAPRHHDAGQQQAAASAQPGGPALALALVQALALPCRAWRTPPPQAALPAGPG
jgi:hypothetical protein